jgi:hypothetical protein
LPITRSHAPEVERLITTLLSGPEVEREAAAARLRVIGARAVDHLLAALDTLSPTQRRMVLPVLEDLPGTRILPAVLPLTRDPETSAAALAVVRQHLRDASEARRASTLIALRLVATDKDVPLAARAAAAEMLGGPTAPEATRARPGGRETGRAAARSAPNAAARALEEQALLTAAVAGELPASPDVLRAALAHHGEARPVSELQDLVNAIASAERGASEHEALEWAGVRAAAHLLLAARESRLGMADLRDTVERWHDRLPMGFVVALGEIGDAESLESLAAAYERAESEWVREQIVGAFRQVLRRHRLTRRHAAVKRAERRSAALAARL